MRRTNRIKQIEQILLEHPDGLRVREISEKCRVDRRTIYRDLADMQKTGIPLWQMQGRYGIERERYFAALNLNLNEVFTLLWALRLLRHHLESDNPHAGSLSKKISLSLPPDVAKQIELLRQPRPASDKRSLHILEALTRAWADSLKVLIHYHNPQQARPVARVIAPYLLECTPKGRLYLIGWDEANREMRVFKLKRITRAEVLEDEPFRRSPAFDPQAYLSAELGEDEDLQTVVLRFDPQASIALKEKPPTLNQRIEHVEDGSSLLIAEVKDWHEMENWVRSWGAQVEVLAPGNFRRTIAAEFRQAAKLYG